MDLTINEFADVSSRNSPDMLFKVMGFGQPPAVLNKHILAEVKVGFANSFRRAGQCHCDAAR